MTTEPYPLDTSSIRKGDLIPLQQLVQITKAQPGTTRFAFGLLKLKAFIGRALALRGEPATVVIRRSEIVVLNDAEANEYNASFARSGARRIKRSALRHSVIDLSKLTPEQRLDWDRNSARLALMVAGVKMRKLPEMKPHKRIE